jgi:hypothetical protein
MSGDTSTKPGQRQASREETLDGIRDAMQKLDTARKAAVQERDEKAIASGAPGAAARRRRVKSRTT